MWQSCDRFRHNANAVTDIFSHCDLLFCAIFINWELRKFFDSTFGGILHIWALRSAVYVCFWSAVDPVNPYRVRFVPPLAAITRIRIRLYGKSCPSDDGTYQAFVYVCVDFICWCFQIVLWYVPSMFVNKFAVLIFTPTVSKRSFAPAGAT
jgi:hypothetical protein